MKAKSKFVEIKGLRMNKINADTVKLLLPQFIRYFFVGLFCAIVAWAVFYLLNAKLGVFYLLAGTLSWVAGAMVNFALSCVIFKSKEGRRRITEFVMVIIAAVIGLLIDMGTMVFCVRILGFPNMISKIAGTGVAFIFNYASRQFFIFSHK
jgi:putative flippase GtrA